MGRIIDWCEKWDLSPHPSKSKYMIFSKSKIPEYMKQPIILDNITIQNVDSICDLGILFDPKLTFRGHINRLELALRAKLGILWRNLQPIRGSMGLRKIYFALIQSSIDYCLPVWGMAAPSNFKQLESLHRKAIKFVCNIPYYDHSSHYKKTDQGCRSYDHC